MPSNSIPFALKLNEVAEILGCGIGDVRDLVKGSELDGFARPGESVKILTQSVIYFLGRCEFKRRWPGGMGRVDFEEKEKRK